MRLVSVVASFLALQAAAFAQSPRVVRAVGEATVSVRPDQVKLNIGVVTQGSTAQEAAALNASKMDALLARLKSVLGTAGETRTVNYSITPNYRYTQGEPPVLAGFTANNTVQVSTTDMGSAGSIIDAAAQAGANTIGGLQFTLRNPEPEQQQALAAAAKQARAHAEAIAAGLGARVGAVVAAQQGATYTPLPVARDTAVTAPTTPIETGFVQVHATVTVDVGLVQ